MLIVTVLILHVQQNEQATQCTSGQANDINEAEAFVFQQKPQCGFKIISEHTLAVLNSKPPKEYRFFIIYDYQLVGKSYT